MNYLKSSFSVTLGGDAYGEGYDRIFGKKPVQLHKFEAAPDRYVSSQLARCLRCELITHDPESKVLEPCPGT